MAAGDGSRYLVASTACGPALEGAGLTMGMRRTTGAIEAVKYQDGRFVCEVICGGPAKGFCGSGIIDAITQLLVAGIVVPMGNFYKGAKLEGHPLAHQITICEDGQRQFTLLTAEENGGTIPMVITKNDIRAIQLAKGAIHTGCELFLSRYGIQGEDLSEIVISGTFGNYIDIQNAQAIGLLPTFPGTPVRSIGNGAGMGVKRFLLSQEEVARCTALPTITTHVELASDPDFVNTYMMNTQFEDLGGRR
ncbi:ASKHA domain-containing protein [Eubacterium aggregans]|uniref:ASKHA domain-containing protein n=1 Tax=Eubacterium aggregans TaxID=81409 RepID=UPI003F3212A3